MHWPRSLRRARAGGHARVEHAGLRSCAPEGARMRASLRLTPENKLKTSSKGLWHTESFIHGPPTHLTSLYNSAMDIQGPEIAVDALQPAKNYINTTFRSPGAIRWNSPCHIEQVLALDRPSPPIHTPFLHNTTTPRRHIGDYGLRAQEQGHHEPCRRSFQARNSS